MVIGEALEIKTMDMMDRIGTVFDFVLGSYFCLICVACSSADDCLDLPPESCHPSSSVNDCACDTVILG